MRDYKKFNGWQHAIETAEFQLLRAQVAEREMKAVIAVFTEKMKAGEPWPWKDAGVADPGKGRKRHFTAPRKKRAA